MAELEARLVEVEPGRRLFVECEGTGAPVVLLHGFTGSGETLRSCSEGLGPGLRSVRVDLVGHGRSDAPRDLAAYRMERCVADLATVLDALGIERAHWLGYSMGARVALAFAVAHPDRARSLVLVGGRAGLADPAKRRARVAADERLAARLEEQGLEWFVDHWMSLPLFASQHRLGEEARAEARRQRLANRPHGLALSLRGMGAGAQPPLFDALPHLDRPVLLLVGEEDERFDAIAHDLASRLPRARVARVPRAGHAAHLENPAAFARLVRAFLCETGRPPTLE